MRGIPYLSENRKKVETISGQRQTKRLSMPAVVVKVIGQKTYIVENAFSEGAAMNLTDKVRRLIDSDLKRTRTTALQPVPTELTYDKS